MANYITTDTELTAMANAIRLKTGNNLPIAYESEKGFADAIESIPQEGSTTYTIEGLEDYNIAPVASQYVSDSYKGSSAQDKTLSNFPSMTEFFNLFYDKYLSANLQSPLENYTVTKQSLGKDQSNTFDIYEYDFCPANWDRMILLTSGMHTYEVASMLGLAYFMDNMVERHAGDDFLTYLYEHVRIKVIPLINPWGFNQSPKAYGNVNGVNINRNFDYDGAWAEYPVYSPDPQDANYNEWNVKGVAPFSEAETLILKDWLENNLGAEFWIDCHTGTSWSNIDVWSNSLSTSPYYNKVLSAHTKLEAWTKVFYSVDSVNTNYVFDSDGSIKSKWSEGVYNIPMIVIEQCGKSNTWSGSKNGNRNNVVNYTAQIYAYVGEFLLRESETVSTVDYIEQLQQEAIENKKYKTPSEYDRAEATLTRIEAVKTVTSYEVGATLSTADITVTAHYTDNSTANVTSIALIDDSNVDMSTQGTYAINISYTEGGITKTTSISITVAQTVVVELSAITANKTTTSYTVGDSYSDADITVTAVYTNGNTATVTSSAVIDSSNVDTSAVGTYTVNVTYTEDNITKTTSITIIVNAVTNNVVIHSGTLSSATGQPDSNSKRVYTDAFPISQMPCSLIAGSSHLWFGGRIYDANDNYLGAVGVSETADGYYFTGGSLHAGWIDGTVQVNKGSNVQSTPAKLRLIYKNSTDTSLSVDTVAETTVTLDGVTYTLVTSS